MGEEAWKKALGAEPEAKNTKEMRKRMKGWSGTEPGAMRRGEARGNWESPGAASGYTTGWIAA